MLNYPIIDPVLFSIGPLSVRWYGFLHLIGFIAIFAYLLHYKNRSKTPWTVESLADLFFYAAIGMIFGGGIGFWLFYAPATVLADPLVLFKFWLPGRSFHGGLIGVIITVALYCYIHHRSFLEVMDYIAPAVPIGLGLGRLGNFINQELWGRVTDVPWAMIPQGGHEPHHPSQLYEFFLEGVVLFLILHFYASKKPNVGAVSGLFAFCYGIFRFWVEFYREPDREQGFLAFGWLTMGQALSIPLILIGFYLLLAARCKGRKEGGIKRCNNI